jgi:ribosomal protein S1
VPVFLPASQVNMRRTGDIGEFIGKEIERASSRSTKSA